jgi:hypothetical protein
MVQAMAVSRKYQITAPKYFMGDRVYFIDSYGHGRVGRIHQLYTGYVNNKSLHIYWMKVDGKKVQVCATEDKIIEYLKEPTS